MDEETRRLIGDACESMRQHESAIAAIEDKLKFHRNQIAAHEGEAAKHKQDLIRQKQMLDHREHFLRTLCKSVK